MVLLAIAYDLVSLHRIHRSTQWAAPLVFAAGALAVPIGMTPAWQAFALLLNSNHRTTSIADVPASSRGG